MKWGKKEKIEKGVGDWKQKFLLTQEWGECEDRGEYLYIKIGGNRIQFEFKINI